MLSLAPNFRAAAGPGYHAGEATGYLSKGGTGVPVRTLVEMVERIATAG